MEEALKDLFKKTFGARAETAVPVAGHGSARRLWRLTGGGRTAIGAANADPKENAAFIGFSRHFRACGLPVPEIYAEQGERGLYLEEDLGDTTLFSHLSERRKGGALHADTLSVYRKAVELLPRLQIEAGKSLDFSLCYPRASFDRQSMLWDLNYFKYYFLRLSSIPFDEQALEDDFSRFADFLLEADREFFLYRDFQSRNIMVRDSTPWFIDYQGGRRGALQYDIASLTCDAKADLPMELRQELLELYLDAAGIADKAAFLRYYPGFVMIRIMQALGTYGLRGFYEHKSLFLQSIPYALRNLEHLLRTTELPIELPALMGVFKHLIGSSRLRRFGNASLSLTVRVQSFSYRAGAPDDQTGHGGGFVFDCRSLPNPGREERYAKLTGRDRDVAEFLGKQRDVAGFMEHVSALARQAIANYRTRNFTDLLIAFGCTGGRHRSVYCAELLAKRLREEPGVSVELRHLNPEVSGEEPA